MFQLTITPLGLISTAVVVTLLAMYITYQFYDYSRHYEHFTILGGILGGGLSFILGVFISMVLFK